MDTVPSILSGHQVVRWKIVPRLSGLAEVIQVKLEVHLWPLEVGTLLGISCSFQDTGENTGPHHAKGVPLAQGVPSP